ncbi:DUF6916 family protein [Ruicaihuangia caeni]|uniref:DUF6916 domain-containing protein n=1 Tax=Ruicaihuangia caeni TaxID=3042517 RepID=A0AAW6T5F2_9MICO|nr:hypothetical protein [Klugiella sp. YN-L-19]MDI2098992.1 hypothetical protein [Klugiella sp. YN-L-19]
MPTLSRRSLLAGAGAVGVAAVATAVVVGAPRSPSASTASDPATVPEVQRELVRSRFAPHVGDTFVFEAEGRSASLVLDAIDDVAPVVEPDDEHRFNLLFTPAGGELPAAVYRVRHPDAGDAWLFVSSVGTGGSTRHQALVVSAA